MEFDHVAEVHADGTVTDAPSDLYAPEVYDDDVSGGWVLLKGECDDDHVAGWAVAFKPSPETEASFSLT